MANYVLEILDGDRAGEVISVTDRPLRIGRKPGNDVVLADEKTSGVHAEVVLEGDRHVLRDLGSTNGTFLDGKRLTELVLTPGDVVTVGRIRVKFRGQGEAASVDAGELAVRRLDASRLQGRGGSVGLIAAIALLGLGGAGWFWWQGRAAKEDDPVVRNQKRPVLAVAGNKLATEVAGCESENGWTLRAAGGGFQPSTVAHTGTGAFLAQRGEGADAVDFAVLQRAEPLAVFAGRTVTVAAHVQTAKGGQAALRAMLASANEQVPFRFRTGTPLSAADGWQRVEFSVGIPSGCDRLTVEVVGVLPTPDATVAVDDIAVTEAGNAPPLEAKLADTGQTALGSGAALAVRSVDAENPAILLGVVPGAVPDSLQGLHKAELCVLSDLGAVVTCTAGERGFQLAVTNCAALQFVLPSGAQSGLLIGDGDNKFTSAAADGEFTAHSVLVGDRLTRALLRFAGPMTCRGRTASGVWRLNVPTAQCELVLGFRGERQQAAEKVRQARRARDENRPGAALDTLRELAQTMPMDSEMLGQASELRAELLGAQSQRLQALQKDLEVASFFSTRGGFERVVLGVDEMIQLYGEHNLEDKATPMALRQAAAEKLAAIDGKNHGAQRARLDQLSKAFQAAAQEDLAKLVQEYVQRNLQGK